MCNNDGHVIGLNLSSESISGIHNSSSLFDLQYLQRLNLAYNNFDFTEIPPGFDKLTSLTYLNLSFANFAGQIPIEISRLTRLVTLDLSSLYFDGLLSLKLENPNLLTLVGNLKGLNKLYLDGVNISAQRNGWCQALAVSVPNLQDLSLSNCQLSGPIDPSLAKLKSLSVIRLDNNNLSSSVPEFLANFPNLTSLRLSSCWLNGTFPEKIFQVPTLQTLDLSNNKMLEGSLPEFPPNGSLQTLVLIETNFSGKLPASMGYLEKLSRIELTSCNFNGSIPNSMASLVQLVHVDLSSNGFTGPVPSFSSMRNLTELSLAHNHLNGSISSTEWKGLSRLVNLDLRNNSLNGSIPLSLFDIPSLQQIQLSHNRFTSEFQELLNVSSSRLNTLDLSSNNLQGQFPESVFRLKSLKILSLSSNNFSGALELNVIQQLTNLSSLDLSYNSLSILANGTSSTLSPFPQITTLKLAFCKLTTIPEFLRNQTRLSYLDLSNNQIHGEIPIWIWKLDLLHLNLSSNFLVDLEGPLPKLSPSLSVLDLHSNQIKGQIPIFPPSASYLDYSRNNFSSIIPEEIGYHLNFTIFFSLSSNHFHGNIPNTLCSGTYLQVLDLSNNSLTGVIPKCLTTMSGTLRVLNLRRNNLIGSISDTFPSQCGLKTLDVNRNLLTGKLPISLASCRELEVLDLGNNQINDTFPCWLKSASSLRVLVLRSNKFQGGIGCPQSNFSWEKLQIIDLASNNFSGKLPAKCLLNWKAMMVGEDEAESKLNHLRFEFLGLSGLYYQDEVLVTSKGLEMKLVKILTLFTSIDFSCNNFEGNIPEVLGDFKALYVLNLSHNALTGGIPSALGKLKQIESLDLSRNNLTGAIPVQLANLNFLSFLNLSYNQLVGVIPTSTQLQSFSETSFTGNIGLCGPPLNVKCTSIGGEPPTMPRPEVAASNSGNEFDWQFIMSGLGFGVGAAIVVGPLTFSRRGRKWHDECTDKLLLMILPAMGLIYKGCNDGKVDADETVEEEDGTEDYEDEDEMDSEEFHGRFCVYCSKLDISRKRAIHNPNCTCHHSPVSSSYSSSFSSETKAIKH